MKNVIFLFVCVFSPLCDASFILLEPSSDVITDGLTDLLTIRCSLRDTITGRDVTQTNDNVRQVTSIMLMHNGEKMASINRPSSPQHISGSTTFLVKGSLTGTSGDQAYLEVDIRGPRSRDTGEFTCQIEAVGATQPVTFSDTVEVSSEQPTLADLSTILREMKTTQRAMQQGVSGLETSLSDKGRNSQVFFSVGISSDMSVNNGDVVVYDKVFANIGSGYDTKTGLFTCRSPGFYHFGLSAMTKGTFRLRLFLNDRKDFSVYATHSDSGATNSGILELSQGDVVRVVSEQSAFSHLSSSDGSIYTTFSGRLIAAST